MEFLQEMVDQHQSGLRDYSTPLWTLLMFEAFLRGNAGNAAVISTTRAVTAMA
jgi:asparagine synthase (glutamine-hydrolysing)